MTHGGPRSRDDSSSAALSASYEIDLWGRNAAGARAAVSSLRATRFDQEAVRLTLAAGVARAYFQLLSLLDAQRTLFQAQDQLAQIRLSRLLASVGLFKALGGGWIDPDRASPG